jgi:hypothetical protein
LTTRVAAPGTALRATGIIGLRRTTRSSSGKKDPECNHADFLMKSGSARQIHFCSERIDAHDQVSGEREFLL